MVRVDHEQTDRIGEKSPGDERDRLRRRLIQPLRIVDDADQRLLRAECREQARARRGRPRTDPAVHPRAYRTRCVRRLAAVPGARPAGRAPGRTADAVPRTATPSPTPRQPPARPVRRTRTPRRGRRARSCPTPASPRTTSTPLPPRRVASMTRVRISTSCSRPTRPEGKLESTMPDAKASADSPYSGRTLPYLHAVTRNLGCGSRAPVPAVEQ